MTPTLLTISGPCYAGKTTLQEHLVTHGAVKVPSFTTRPPRPNETDGVHYQFRSRQWVVGELSAGRVLECTVFAGHHYGTTVGAARELIGRGRLPVKVADPDGVQSLKRALQGVRVVALYLDCPADTATQRMLQRYLPGGAGARCSDHAELLERLDVYWEHERHWLELYGDVFDVVAPAYSAETQARTLELVRQLTGHPLAAESVGESVGRGVSNPSSPGQTSDLMGPAL